MENELREILDAGLAAADPKDAVIRSVRLDGEAVLAEDARFEPERIFVIAAGKAAGSMARAAQELFGGRIEAGIVVTKDGHDGGPEDFETVFASHPEPDERGVEASRKGRELAGSLGGGGGASAPPARARRAGRRGRARGAGAGGVPGRGRPAPGPHLRRGLGPARRPGAAHRDRGPPKAPAGTPADAEGQRGRQP